MLETTKEEMADETNKLVHKTVNKIVDKGGIFAGWPCQDASIANSAGAKGIEGQRTGLWSVLFRTIRLVRPKIVGLENVAELLNRGVGKIFGQMASIGYDCEWHCIRAEDVGLPHKRERFFALAYPASDRIQRRFPKEIQRQRGIPWGEDIRGLEDLRSRPDIPQPLVRKLDAWGRAELHIIGNANPPEIIRQITKEQS